MNATDQNTVLTSCQWHLFLSRPEAQTRYSVAYFQPGSAIWILAFIGLLTRFEFNLFTQ